MAWSRVNKFKILDREDLRSPGKGKEVEVRNKSKPVVHALSARFLSFQRSAVVVPQWFPCKKRMRLFHFQMEGPWSECQSLGIVQNKEKNHGAATSSATFYLPSSRLQLFLWRWKEQRRSGIPSYPAFEGGTNFLVGWTRSHHRENFLPIGLPGYDFDVFLWRQNSRHR